jgi:hypothetical protein
MSLQKIQQELKAPKNQFNSFGKYNYRSCEDILEGVKPLLKEHDCQLTLSDEMIEVGGRVYVKATATFTALTGGEKVIVSACAREPVDRKGMDDSQITGATSSYARKYALNGLFCIDDTKDADTQDNSSTPPPSTTSSTSQPAAAACISEPQGKRLFAICKESGTTIADCANKFGFKKAGEIKKSDYKEICGWAESGQKAEMVQEVFDESQPNPDDIPF